MRNWGLAIIVLGFVAIPVLAQATAPAPSYAIPAKRVLADRALAGGLAWQIALEREGFSPGLIDGKIGAKTRVATESFQRANGLPATGVMDAATQEHLKPDPDHAVIEYAVQPSDLEGITPLLED